MKVTTDGCLFGAWVAERVRRRESGVGSPESGAGSILDIGSGTGLLSLMIAQQCNAEISTVEIDKESFEQASENVAASPWADRIKVFHADARDPIAIGFEFSNKYDVIISNPPFYENELNGENLKKNLAHHNQGLLLWQLLTIIKKNLKPDGTFFLLLPHKRNVEIRKLLTESELAIRQLIIVRQSTKHNFLRVMLAGKIRTEKNTETLIDEIFIKNEHDQYTPEFVNLLKDYYLYL